MDVVEAQEDLLNIGLEVQRIEHQLYTLAAGLALPANQAEMFECNIPLDLAAGVYAKIEFLREGSLSEVIEDLKDAATLTVEKLEHRFRKLQERDGGGLGAENGGVNRGGSR